MADGPIEKSFKKINDIMSNGEDSSSTRDSDAAKHDDKIVGKLDNKVRPQLTGNEKTRAINAARIWHQEFFNQEKKNTPDEKGKTQVATPAKAAINTQKKSDIPQISKGKSGLGMFGWIGLIIAGVLMLSDWLQDNLGPVGQFFVKLPAKLLGLANKLGFLKKVGNTIKVIGKSTGLLGKMLGGLVAKFGGRILKVLKFLPFIGSIVSFGFAYSRWKKGEYIPAIFEAISGIANLIPGAGNIVSILIDGGLLFYDLHMAKKEKTKEVKEGGKGGFWEGIKKNVGGFLMKAIKWLPLTSGIMYLWDAGKHLLAGNWTKGFTTFGKALLGFIGGEGLVIGVTKGIEWLTGLFNSKEAEPIEPKKDTGTWQSIKDKFKGFMMSNLRMFPIIGSCLYFFDAINSFKSGQWGNGLIDMAKGIISIIPGGGFIVQGLMWLGDFLGGEEQTPSLPQAEKSNFTTGLITAVKEKAGKAVEEGLKWAGGKALELANKGADMLKGVFGGGSSGDDTLNQKHAKAVAEAKRRKAESDREERRLIFRAKRKIEAAAAKKGEIISKVADSIVEHINQMLNFAREKLIGANAKFKYSSAGWLENITNSFKVEDLSSGGVQAATITPAAKQSISLLAGIKSCIQESNAYLRQIAQWTQTQSQGSNSSASVIAVPGGSSQQQQSPDPVSSGSSRNDYFSSPYSLNVPSHDIMA
jgi:hypothetical protein